MTKALRARVCFYCGWYSVGTGVVNGHRKALYKDCRKACGSAVTDWQPISTKTTGGQ